MASSGGTTKTLVWILMGLLILGLGGFGATNLSSGVRSIGNVGSQEISVDDYARALQRELRGIQAQTGAPVTFSQAQAAGLDQRILSQLVNSAAMDDETMRMGLSIGDANLSKQIFDIPSFQGVDGNFDREGYAYALRNAGLTEAEFEEDLRQETARTLVQGAVISGVSVPAAHVDALVDFVGARRDFTWAKLTQKNLTEPTPPPTADELRSYHQSHLPDFTLPEMKRITYAWITPDMILDTVEVDEAALAALYDERKAEFNTEERRLVERLAFADEAAAEAAKAAIETGDKSFEDLVSDRGLELTDVDMGDVARGDLGAAADAVFGSDVGQITGPFTTSLGPALYRVNAILPAEANSFDEVKDRLRDELALDRARRVIEAQAEAIDDMLAGGATLEDVAKETELVLAQVDWHAESGDDIAAYPEFDAAAEAITADDFPEVAELEDGGIYAMRLEEILAPRAQTLDEVRDAVAAAWEAAETESRLRAQAEALLPQLENGVDFAGVGLTATVETDVLRNGFIPGTPEDYLEQVFDMALGDILITNAFGGVIITRLDAQNGPDMDNGDVAALAASLREQAQAAVAQDIYEAYIRDIRSRVDVNLNTQAVNAVNASLQ